MVAPITTPFGDAIPPFPAHSITAHIPFWSTILQFLESPQSIIGRVKSIYPRFGPFGNVKNLILRLSADHLKEGQACLLFATQDSAEACRDFITSEKREDKKANAKDVDIKVFDFRVRLWAAVFPASKMEIAVPFWQDPGTGISSRIAKDCIDYYSDRKELECLPDSDPGLSLNDPAFDAVRIRIAHLLNRAPIKSHPNKVETRDVFLYPTGMSAIYQLHRYLQRSSLRPGATVLLGFAFHSTPHLFKEYGTNYQWLARGNEDFEELETLCEKEREAGRQVQAVWAEFPTNPNLRSLDLERLRALADKHGFYIFLDDTISSFANVDLLGVADAIVTSLTKSFAGYANVMGGSVVLNPNSKHYDQLIDLCDQSFVNEYYSGDVEAILQNSDDYLERSTKLNNNALAVVQYLESLIDDPTSAVVGVGHPSTGPDAKYFNAVMRPATAEFTSGHGCLFSVELDSDEATIAFYDNLGVHQGPHLGAHLSLAIPYVKAFHNTDMEFAIRCGMNGKMIRVSVGLEDTGELLRVFKTAVEAANAVKSRHPLEKAVNPMVESNALGSGKS